MLGDRRQKCIQRVEYKSCKDAAVLQANSWTLRWAVPICHWLREEPLAAAASRQDSTKGGTLKYPQHKHSTHVHSYSRGALLSHPNSSSI